MNLKRSLLGLAIVGALALTGTALAQQEPTVGLGVEGETGKPYLSGKGLFPDVRDVPGMFVPKNPKGPFEMTLPDGYFPPAVALGTELDEGGLEFPTAGPITEPVNVDSISFTGWIPPDCVMAGGNNHAIVCVNDDFAIYDRFGTLLEQNDINTFTGDTRKIFDPRVIYDEVYDRYIMIWDVIDYTEPNYTAAESVVKMMVSSTSDPTGTWITYNLNVKDNDGTTARRHWLDYPHVGVNSTMISITGRMFPFSGSGGTGSYDKALFLDRAEVYAAATASLWVFRGFSSDGSDDVNITATHMKSTPSSGAGVLQTYLLSAKWFSHDSLTLWRFNTPSGGPVTFDVGNVINVVGYTSPNGLDQQVQPNLESVGPRLMNSTYYVGKIYAAHASRATFSGVVRDCIQAFRITNASPPVVEWDTHSGSTGNTAAYPAIAAGTDGTAYIAFARSSQDNAEFAGVRYLARESADGAWNGSYSAKAGEAWYFEDFGAGRNRWGDYFGCSTDVWDQNSFWVYGQFAKTTNTWDTWLTRASYKPYATVVAANKTGEITESVTLTATVTNSSTASVISGISVAFKIDAVSVGSATTNASGVASLAYTIPFAVPGTDTITATTSESSVYLGDSDTAVLTKTKHTPLITTYPRPNYQYAQNALLHSWLRRTDGTAISGATISFTVGGTAVGSQVTDAGGDAWLDWNITKAPGTYSIVGSYAGSTYYNAVSDAADLTVILATTSLVADDVTGAIGTSVNLTATLTRVHDGWLMGAGYVVAFQVGGVAVGSDTTDTSGVASLAYAVPAGVLGNSVIQADFAGTSLHAASSDTATFTKTANTTLTVANASGQRLATVPLSATLRRAHDSALITGRTVNFTVDAVAVGGALTNASGVASVNFLIPGAATVGAHVIGASFAGEPANFLNASSGTGTLTVTKWDTNLTVPNQVGTAGQTVALTATLRRTIDTALVAAKSVSFTVGGVGAGSAVTNASGVASLNWVVTIGTLGAQALAVNFAGDADYNASAGAGTFTRNGKTLGGTVTLQDWTATRAGLIARVNVYDASNVLRDSFNATLNASGVWSRANSPISTGNHRVEIKVWHWLNRAGVNAIGVSGNSSINRTLINGDVDDDNEVGPGDFGILSSSFGSVSGDTNWDPAADLDGDGEVGPSDFGILSANFGQSGD